MKNNKNTTLKYTKRKKQQMKARNQQEHINIRKQPSKYAKQAIR